MPIESENSKVKNDAGEEKDVLTIKFNNGALEQLTRLKAFYNLDEETDVIKMGISFLQKITERESPKKDNQS